MGPHWTTIQLDVTQIWYQKLCLMTKDDQFELCLPHYLATAFISPLYVYIRKFTVLGFCKTP